MSATFQVGEEIGAYRVVRPLGAGGMGAVYEVEHKQLGVHYALKTFTLEEGNADVLRDKFLTEGKILARLHNPHLVRVFDLDFDAAMGTPYYVMDLVLYQDGEPHTLADIDTEDLDETYILDWFRELAEALDYIHAQGIVHRDIKLSNVILSSDRHAILSDFGISRLFKNKFAPKGAVNTLISEAATGVRLVMGTEGYMAPEIERGEEATPAADVYSLGVMLFYLLTGIWYEPGSKALRLLEGLERRWVDILPKMLSTDPEARPQILVPAVDVLCQNLATVPTPEAAGITGEATSSSLQQKEISNSTPSRRPKHRKVWVLTSMAVLVLVLAVLLALTLFRSTPAPADAPVAAPNDDAAFTSEGVFEVSP